jgi:hypothetical protein
MTRTRLITAARALALVAAACGGDPGLSDEATTAAAATGAPPISETATSGAPSTSAPTPSAAATTTDVEIPPALRDAVRSWDTEWSRSTIDLDELVPGLRGGDTRDRIPPIDDPTFETVDEASAWLEDREPGLLVTVDGATRFYPLQILTLHEIVNDELSGTPIAVTYCPLCNTAITFDRRLGDQVLRLGVSGLLRNSDLVMWENTTDSLFQQITGKGIVGALAGRNLTVIPSAIVRFADVGEAHPDAEVLSRDTGRPFPYGANPYQGYSSSSQPFLFDGELDPRYPALTRVVGLTIDGDSKAYPFPEIEPSGAVNDVVGSTPIVVFWGAADTADALDAGRIADSRGIGVGIAFDRRVAGQLLTFERIDDTTFRDVETGSTWSILGSAIDGPLLGTDLDTVPHRNEFWFAWTAFFPEAPVYEA